MTGFYCFIFFVFGTIFGSFYQVVGLRLPLKKSIMKPRSHCDSCQHELEARDLVPLFSYLFQKGKCRYCNSKIPIMTLFSEVFTGLLFAISYYSFGFSISLLISLSIVSLFMIILVSDLTYYIISDEVLIVFGILFFIFQTLQGGIIFSICSLLSGVMLFLVMYGFMKLGDFLFKKESLGGGDVKLMFLVGQVLGPVLGVFTIFFSSLLALPVSLFLLFRKKENMIPFGPFILLAFLILYFMKIDLSSLELLSLF